MDSYLKELKTTYIGISLGSSSSDDSGICILNPENELVKIDKVYALDELIECVDNISGKKNSIICVDLPKYNQMLTGKWRIESKYNLPFNLGKEYKGREGWTDRFSERGTEFCKKLISEGNELYRYNSEYSKIALNIHPYVRSKTPAACKFLQQAIKEKLEIKGLPSNMVARSALDAMIGAYIAKVVSTGKKDVDYKETGLHKNIPVISVC